MRINSLISNKKVYKPLIIIVIYVIMSLFSFNQEKSKIDEYFNHLPILKLIYENPSLEILTSNDYKAANTPLPYYLILIPHKIFKLQPTLFSARVMNILISFITVMLLLQLFQIVDPKYSILNTLLVCFYPYLLKTSFSFYMAIYGLLFYTLFLFILYSKPKPILLGLTLTFAILSQQFYLPLFLLIPILFYLENNDGDFKKLASDFILTLIPLIILALPVFILWGGLTSPAYKFHRIYPDITNLNSILTIIGLTFMPFTLVKIKKMKLKPLLFITTLSLILMIFFNPQFAEKGGVGQITGMTFHILSIIKNQSIMIGTVFHLICLISGGYIIYFALEKINDNSFERSLSLIIIVFTVAFIFNEFLAERHLLPLIVTLYLLLLRSIEQKFIKYGWLTFQAAFGSYYLYYYMFVQESF